MRSRFQPPKHHGSSSAQSLEHGAASTIIGGKIHTGKCFSSKLLWIGVFSTIGLVFLLLNNTTIVKDNNAQRQEEFPSTSGQQLAPHPRQEHNNYNNNNNHACDGFDGIYHIQSGDVGGAAATIFFQFVIAQLIYAEQYNLKPWVFLNNISHHVYDQEIHNATQDTPTVAFTMMKGIQIEHFRDIRLRRAAYPGKPYVAEPLHPATFALTGDGVWDHYFEPVSDFVPGDASCQHKPLVTMDIWLITPGLHIYAPWTPRMWRYSVLPDYMQQRHLTLREWLTPQRVRAHAMTQKYIHVKPHLWNMAQQLLENSGKNNNNIIVSSKVAASTQQPTETTHSRDCVGMHVRWSDKGGGRRLIGVDEFLPYVQRFLQHGGNCIFLATDSGKVIEHIRMHWPAHVRAVLVSQGDTIIRSNDETPVFEIKTGFTQNNHNLQQQQQPRLISHHRTNTEVLVDILALSKCKFLLHGHSAVSDAAMYLNADLIYQSVNLEDPDDFSLDQFGNMVSDVLVRDVGIHHDKYFPQPWWNQYIKERAGSGEDRLGQHTGKEDASSSGGVCDGYRGILHIAVGGGEEFSFGMTFFHFVLNQLLYADMYNLKPWVHLSNETAQATYDESVHGAANEEEARFEMLVGDSIEQLGQHDKDPSSGESHLYPGDIDPNSSRLFVTKLSVSGNGIWESYFAPVSNFNPRNPSAISSCRGKPLIILDKESVSQGMHKWAPWSIKSFRYSGIPDQMWYPMAGGDYKSLDDWYLSMRKKANNIVNKYYRPHTFIWRRVQEVNPAATAESDGRSPRSKCLAVHIRQGDKEGYGKRKLSKLRDYKPFIDAFFRATDGTKASGFNSKDSYVYLATDSWRVIDAIAENWPPELISRIHSQGDHVVRSVRWVPAHLLEPDNHHRVNLEAMVDILAMSQCQYLLHGFSTVSEAAIYMNLDLHERSVNVDDPNHMSVTAFERLVRGKLESINE